MVAAAAPGRRGGRGSAETVAFRCPGVEATYSPCRQVGGSYRKLLDSLASAACQRLFDQAGGGQVVARYEHHAAR